MVRILRMINPNEANALWLWDTADETCSFSVISCDSSIKISNPSPILESKRTVTCLCCALFACVCEGICGSGNQDDLELTMLNESGDFSASGGGEYRGRAMDGGVIGTTNQIGRTRTGLLEPGGFSTPPVGGPIKGLRPPALKPPPQIRMFSRGECSSEANRQPVSFSSFENGYDEEEVKEAEAKAEAEAEMRIDSVNRPGEAKILHWEDMADETCSFTIDDFDMATMATLSSTPLSIPSPNFATEWPIISWQKGQLLGQGSFGPVYEGVSVEGDFFAVKEVSLVDQGSQAQDCIQQLEREIALLSRLKHENIVRYHGTNKDGSHLYIFLELVTQGSLLKLYKRYQLQDSQVSGYTRQILHGLKYLHDQGFVHRDIKCANILVDANGLVKLADFGLAKVTKLNDIKSCKGNPFWMAPEVIYRKTADGYGRPADIWSLGCTVLEMLTGQFPYSDLEAVQALFRIGRGILPSVPDTLSIDARDFILRCLKVEPDERPTASQLLNHPFVRRPVPTSSGSSSPYLRRKD